MVESFLKLRYINLFVLLTVLLIFVFTFPRFEISASSSKSIQFSGNSSSRFSFPISANGGLVNVGAGDFTIDFWIYPTSFSSGAGCSNGIDVFTNGRLIVDRDIYGPGDYGDFGISLMNDGRIAFSVHNGSTGVTACSNPIPLNAWTYVAAVKQGNQIRIYINGSLNQTQNFSGSSDLSYRTARITSYTADPHFVIGAEKHTAIGGETFTAYHFAGLMDELRISNVARSISMPTSPFTVDSNTVALFRFEDNVSSAVGSFSGSNVSGINYSTNIPFSSTTPTPTPTFTSTSTPTFTLTSTPTSTNTPTPTAFITNTSTPTPTFTFTPTPTQQSRTTPTITIVNSTNTPTPSPNLTINPSVTSTVTPTSTITSTNVQRGVYCYVCTDILSDGNTCERRFFTGMVTCPPNTSSEANKCADVLPNRNCPTSTPNTSTINGQEENALLTPMVLIILFTVCLIGIILILNGKLIKQYLLKFLNKKDKSVDKSN